MGEPFNHPNHDPQAFDASAPFAEFAMGGHREEPSIEIRAAATYDVGSAIADATLGQDPIGGLFNGLIGTPAIVQGGLSVWQQVQSMAGWIAVCVRAKCNGVSKVPLRTYWRPNGKTPTRELINDPDLPLHQLFNNPNPLDIRSGLWDFATIFHELTGNGFWLKVRDGSKQVRELWPIPSQYLTPAHTKKRILDGYWMQPPYAAPFMIPREDVIHFKQSNPMDRFWGLGTLAAASNSMRVDDQIKAARLMTFNNDILSSVYFTTDQVLDDPTWKRLLATLRNHHTGAAKAGTPMILPAGLKPAQLTRPPREMQFKDSGCLTRDEILSVFSTPPLIAGVVENANNSNTASQERVWALYGLRPLLSRYQERINKDLVPEFDSRLEVEFDDPVPLDRKEQADIDKIYLDSGAWTVNDVRQRQGMDDVAWGDQPAPSATKGTAPPADPSAPVVDNKQLAVQKIARTGTAVIIRSQPRRRRKRSSQRRIAASNLDEAGRGRTFRGPPAKQSRRLLIRSIEQDHAKLEAATIPMLRKYFAAQSNRIKANVRRLYDWVGDYQQADPQRAAACISEAWHSVWTTTGGGECYARMFRDGTTVVEQGPTSESRSLLGAFVEVRSCRYDDGVWQRMLIRVLKDPGVEGLDEWDDAANELAAKMLPKIEESLALGGQMQLDALDLDATFNVQNLQAQDWLRQKDRQYWLDTVTHTTKSLLSEKLASVMADKPTVSKLVAAVDEVMAGRIQSSSKTIALTETLSGYSAGSDITRSQCGVTKKEWIATLDGRTRVAHYAANGQIVAQSGTFTVGGEQLKCPGDPRGRPGNVIRCRCVASAIVGRDDQIHLPGEGPSQPEPAKQKPASKKPKQEKPATLPIILPTIPGHITYSKKEVDKNNPYEVFGEDFRQSIPVRPASEQEITAAGDRVRAFVLKQLESQEMTAEAIKRNRDKFDQLLTDLAAKRKELAAMGMKFNDIESHPDVKALASEGLKLKEKVNGVIDRYADVVSAEVQKTLAGIRDLGFKPGDFPAVQSGANPKSVAAIKGALSKYPTDWTKTFADGSKTLTVDDSERGVFYRQTFDMSVGGPSATDAAKLKTGVHEIGHRFEGSIQGMMEFQEQFYVRRTGNEPVRQMWRDRPDMMAQKPELKSELGRDDKFLDRYMGRDYAAEHGYQSRKATGFEILTVGVENLVGRDTLSLLEKDPDYANFILGALSGL